MNAVVDSVRSLWIPLAGVNLLLPNVSIAEVINYQPVDMMDDGPDWLIGGLRWRDQNLPIVSIERIFGISVPHENLGSRISIVNSVRSDSTIRFFAIVTTGIPRLFSADADALGESVREGREYSEAVADCVRIGSEEALIPRLEVIQQMVEKAWNKVRA